MLFLFEFVGQEKEETKVVTWEDFQEIKKSRLQLKVAMSLQVQLYLRQHPFLKEI